MIRNLSAATALAVVVSKGSLAAQTATTTVDQGPTADSHLASNMIGKKVYNGTDDNASSIGSVDDVLFNKSGSVESILVGVGGLLGIGEKDVAVPWLGWLD